MSRGWARWVLNSMMLMIASSAAGTLAFADAPDPQDSGSRKSPLWTSWKCAGGRSIEPSAGANPGQHYLIAPSFLYSLRHMQDCADSDAHGFHRLAKDQLLIWTFPARLDATDVQWLLPLSLAAAGTLATDTEFSRHLSNSPSRLKYSSDFSNYGLGAMTGLAGGLFLWGELAGGDHQRETGFLAGEAAANSLALAYTLKYAFGRARPLDENYQGNLRSGGDSFPSEHAAAAWSIASVVAHEYPGTLTQLLMYGMASAVSVSRLTAKQHFPSDVLAGSAIGWLSGEIVYRTHHDPQLGGSTWETFSEARDYLEAERPRRNMGTTFVELDSWVYPALERLAGLGYIHNSAAGLRPWTRMQCALLTEEAGEHLLDAARAPDLPNTAPNTANGRITNTVVKPLLDRLRHEFAYEESLLEGGRNTTSTIDSLYARTVSISGPALTDGFHFGQTVSYDFGRPFERGTNEQLGGSWRAAVGPVAIFVRTEFQHAPGAPALSGDERSVIALRDFEPEAPPTPLASINRPQLLDAYAAVNWSNWQIVAGQQTLSWGPGLGGSLLWSNNSQPVDMVRLVNSEPERLPGVLKFLGMATVDQFIGRLAGITGVPHPFIYGNKITIKPLPVLEIGYGRTVTIGGRGGDPLTPGNFLHSYFGLQSAGTLGTSVPGDSHSDLDWSFYIPKLRNYLVFYGDWYSDDDFIAAQTPTHSAYRPGLYLTQFPGMAKLDLHIEAANTESPIIFPGGAGNTGDLNYWNFIYREGYTNNGNLIGNVVGRMGQTYQGWLTYWQSPRNTFQLTYKNSSVASAFIPGGGAWQDYALKNETYLKSGFYCKTQLQYEHIQHYPILFLGTQNNVTATLEIGFSTDVRQK